jgi:thioredoxin reductase (NADPH)
VHRRDAFRAERILQERLFARPNVEIVWNHVVDEILGDDLPAPTVRAVRLKNVHTHAHETRQVDGVFVAIGHHPASDLFVGQLDCKPNGYIKTVPGSTVTSVPGVFAAGDVADDIYRQAVTAAGLGCMAALEAEKWLTLEAVTKIAAE